MVTSLAARIRSRVFFVCLRLAVLTIWRACVVTSSNPAVSRPLVAAAFGWWCSVSEKHWAHAVNVFQGEAPGPGDVWNVRPMGCSLACVVAPPISPASAVPCEAGPACWL